MVINEAKLTEMATQELKNVLLEKYARAQLAQVLAEQEMVSTAKIEELLEDVVEALGLIDLSIDYLTAALTGNDPASIGVAQRVLGRGSRRAADVSIGKPGS